MSSAEKCLHNGFVPFIIDEDKKLFYYRGLHEWSGEKNYLTGTCLAAQEQYKKYPDYYRIKY